MTPESPEDSLPQLERSAAIDEIEGVDYLVDYYAVLGLERGVDDDAIKAALREQRSQYHPDRLVKAAPELQATATEKMALFARAEQVLLAEGRARYDELLEGFDPDLVSTNGMPIISIDRRRVLPDVLVSGATPDYSQRISQAKRMLGFDEAKLTELKALFEADPDNSVIRKLYRDELNNQLGIMQISEGVAWSDAGVLNQEPSRGLMIAAPGQYTGAVNQAIETVRNEELGQELDRHRRALGAGVGEQRLLTAGGPGTDMVEDDHLARLTAAAQEAFDERSGAILEAAERTQAAIAELLKLTEFEYLHRVEGPEPIEVILADGDEVIGVFSMGFKADSNSLEIGASDRDPESVSAEREATHEQTVIVVQRNWNLPSPLMEPTFAAEVHFGLRDKMGALIKR
jgi:curved DNA-binding protein CbpA